MPMAMRLFEEFDKATFDYSETEFEEDLNNVEQMAEGEFVDVEADTTKTNEIKSKVVSGFKAVASHTW